MKKTSLILGLLLAVIGNLSAQIVSHNKITPDLLKEVNVSVSSNEMFQVIIIMDEQLDAQKLEWQTRGLNKSDRKAIVTNELRSIAEQSQKKVLIDLQQGQKATMVDNIKTFWIINGICCSMTKDMVFAMANRPDVKYIMKDLDTYLVDGEDSEEVLDDRSSNQWNVTKVNADDVWDLGYTGVGVIVAVIDSGVNYNHTDIANNMWDGGTDYPNHGWDFVNKDNDPMDDQGHGTHCAGTVSSYGTNGKQCGIAKDAKIMALKVLGSDGHGAFSSSWAAIEFAITHDADILSMSLGADGLGGHEVERRMMEHVLYCGVIASVAAGNTGDKYENSQLKYPVPYNVGSPGNCPSPWHNPDQTLAGGLSATVTVGATDSYDNRSSFSSFGPVTWATGQYIGEYSDYPWIDGDPTAIGLIKPDIAAPGSGIYSLDYSNNTGYTSKNGTSMATPCVAGVMALMLQADPSLTPLEIDSIIEVTAVACGGQTSKNNTFGAGRIDALAAVNYIVNACAAPSGLNAHVEQANVSLNWTAAEGISSYRLYRNDEIIVKSITNTSYTDLDVPAGQNTYYVRSNGDNGKTSIASNYVMVNVTVNNEAYPPIISNTDDLNSQVSFAWEAPSRNEVLHYTNTYTSFGGNETDLFIAGQKFPSAMLRTYAGMQINAVSFYTQNANSDCTVSIYEGDLSTPGTLVHQGSVAATLEAEKVTYTFPVPIVINPNKDLWITLSLNGEIAYDRNYAGNNNTQLYQHIFENEDSIWYWYGFGAWTIDLTLSDGTYSYNVYCDNTILSTQQAENSYSTTLTDGFHSVYVTAITNGFESPNSNSLTFVKGQQSIYNPTISATNKLVVAANSTLTVTGSLTNTDPDNLVIEDGAQLIHHSDGVKATVKRSITTYTSDSDGWYTIAAPFTEFSPTQVATGSYDLYAYDEDGEKEWINYKAHLTDFPITQTNGYLYAHSPSTTINMTGTLNNGDFTETVNLSYGNSQESIKGYNLLGNPTTHDITFTTSANVSDGYYYLENGDQWVYSASNTVPSGRGFLVKAEAPEQSVTLNQTSREKTTDSFLCIKIDNQKTYVKMGEGVSMPLLDFKGKRSNTYLIRNGQPYIMLVKDDQNEIPVCFKAPKDGEYTLTVSTTPNSQLPTPNYLHLVDNLTGADIDLLQTPNYSFNALADDYESRFKLVFSESEVNDPGEDEFDITDDSLEILDVTGRVVATDLNTKLTPGVYILKNANNNKTKKIIIN